MRLFVVSSLIIALAGCTTWRPVEGTAAELQQRVTSGALLKTGDRVLIVTSDKKSHRFRVTRIETGLIEGSADSVAIDEVAVLKKREFSAVKTIVLATAVALTIGLGALVAASMAPAVAL